MSERIFWSSVASSRRGTRGSICATISRIAGARGPASTSGADVERPRGAVLELRGEERRGEEDRRDLLAVSLHGGFHDADNPDVGRWSARDCRDVQAPAECAALHHGGEAFGDDRHLGDVAPVRRGEIAALKEVEPQGPEEVATGRRTDCKRPSVRAQRSRRFGVRGPQQITTRQKNLVAESGRGGGPQEIATRQPCGLDSWKS